MHKLIRIAALVIASASPSPAVTWYVATNGNDSADGTTWVTAKASIQSAIDAAASYDQVLVSNGVYATGGRIVHGTLTNRIAVTNAISVRSVNGAEVTTIQGAGPAGDNAVRCAYLGSNAILSGFTLLNGFTKSNGDDVVECSAGAAWCESSSFVSDCHIVSNFAAAYGGGTYRGTLINCELVGNYAKCGGGGSFGGTLSNCTLTGNTASDEGGVGGGCYGATLLGCTLTGNGAIEGGAAYYATLSDCEVVSNYAEHGGGVSGGTLTRCRLAFNHAGLTTGGAGDATLIDCALLSNDGANVGGGAQRCIMERCVIAHNVAEQGGGASSSTLTNCMVIGNSAAYGAGGKGCAMNNCVIIGNSAAHDNMFDDGYGGGAFSSTLINCTVVSNYARQYAGGTYQCVVNNSIVYDNTCGHDGSNYLGGAFTHSCTAPIPAGAGNVADPPLFVDASTGDYHLTAISPCTDNGDNQYSPGSVDLDGNPRIANGIIDMGAYEFQWSGDGDTDSDGIPDNWESLHGLNPAAPNGHTSDSDGDRLTDWQEYIADTDPTNASSLLLIATASSPSPGILTLHVDPTSPTRVYGVQCITSLRAEPQIWTSSVREVTGSGTSLVFTVTNQLLGSSYRISVRLP